MIAFISSSVIRETPMRPGAGGTGLASVDLLDRSVSEGRGNYGFRFPRELLAMEIGFHGDDSGIGSLRGIETP
jgi:hypothetical protein